jgi:hypothetical protein
MHEPPIVDTSTRSRAAQSTRRRTMWIIPAVVAASTLVASFCCCGSIGVLLSGPTATGFVPSRFAFGSTCEHVIRGILRVNNTDQLEYQHSFTDELEPCTIVVIHYDSSGRNVSEARMDLDRLVRAIGEPTAVLGESDWSKQTWRYSCDDGDVWFDVTNFSECPNPQVRDNTIQIHAPGIYVSDHRDFSDD